MKIKLSFILFAFIFVQCTNAQTEMGMASYYSDKFQGSKTASGEKYDKNLLTAAHKTLPFGTRIRVTNQKNNKSVEVTVNDRGPFVKGFIVDLSRKAAKVIDMELDGIVKVKLEVLSRKKKISEAPPVPAPSKPLPRPVKTVNSSTEVSKPVPQLGNPDHNLYKIQVYEQPKVGFGVQLGMYAKHKTLLRQVGGLQAKWYKNIIVALHTKSDGTSLYKVILGPFPDRKTADSYLADVKDKGLKGFVVDLSKL